MTLTEFLLARILEAETEARWLRDLEPVWIVYGADNFAADYHPARVLAECEAKRWVVMRHRRYGEVYQADGLTYSEAADLCLTCGPGDTWQAQQESYGEYPCAHLLVLGFPYADHPDYRPEWRPTA